jgi:hypothetical protein
VTFLAPAFMVAAGLIAGAVVAIHFIVTREPRTVPLPTARFAPVRPIRARARKLRLQDLLLLLLRVLVILAVGAGLAQPLFEMPRQELARILLVDRSRTVADPSEVADSARALFRDGDAIVVFDSTAVVLRNGVPDSLAGFEHSFERGRLSTGLIAAMRAATEMRERADAFELAVISPLAAEQADLALDSIRALWPGAIRLVRVSARADTAKAQVVAFAGAADDPLRLALHDPRRPEDQASNVRVVRTAPDAADSAWAESAGRVLLHWPATHSEEDPATSFRSLSAPWSIRALPDTVGGLSVGDAVLVAQFERWAEYGSSTNGTVPRAVGWWVDGAPAAVEAPHGAGCIRTVAVSVPSRGDLVLHPRFVRLVDALTGPCGGARDATPLDSVRLASLAGSAAGFSVSRSALPARAAVRSPLVPWLYAAGLAFALAALLLQYRVSSRAVPVTGGKEDA